MSDRPPKPENQPWMMPYLTVRDCSDSLAFYEKAFGFKKRFALDGPEGKLMHAEVQWNDAVVMMGPECAMEGQTQAPVNSGVNVPVSLFIYCEDVDAQYERAVAAGAESTMPPTDMFWGDRMCKVKDPDGYEWSFATNVADFDPSKAPC